MISKKLSEALSFSKAPFSAIVFDCDGVLIDATRSYDQTLELSASAFASLLGFKLPSEQFRRAIESLRRLGTFNNDWDALAVITAYVYAKSSTRQFLDSISLVEPHPERIRAFESAALDSMKRVSPILLDFQEFDLLLASTPSGALRDEIIAKLILDSKLLGQYYRCVSYPKPVEESLLGRFFDEAMYGQSLFQNTYGIECATSIVSKPGFIQNERLLVSENVMDDLVPLCSGNFGILTGRPKIPTIFSLGKLFTTYFKELGICQFLGDYSQNDGEWKPSPKPMIRIGSILRNKESPILYVGDSGEDLALAKKANESGKISQNVLFAAIASSKEKEEYFAKQGVDCIVSGVNELPTLLSQKILEKA